MLRESLSAALYRLEGPLNVMRSAIGMLKHREPAMSGALSTALAEGHARLEELRQQRGAQRRSIPGTQRYASLYLPSAFRVVELR
ncbi:MAG: hypothetical protein LBB76_12400 [Azoarcus sp.]|nr:hypothetical protein [Azoarcus sp.]